MTPCGGGFDGGGVAIRKWAAGCKLATTVGLGWSPRPDSVLLGGAVAVARRWCAGAGNRDGAEPTALVNIKGAIAATLKAELHIARIERLRLTIRPA
jgi:hypothetical protein